MTQIEKRLAKIETGLDREDFVSNVVIYDSTVDPGGEKALKQFYAKNPGYGDGDVVFVIPDNNRD